MLEAINLSYRYQRSALWILNNINFSIHNGEMIALVSPNGSGKSTLFQALAGLLCVQGTVRVNGREHRPQANSNLGLVSASVQMHRGSVSDQLLFLADLHSIPHTKIFDLVERLRMQKFVSQSFSCLSSGQKQLVNIVRAVMHEPAVLLLDEPATALDMISQQHLMDLIHDLKPKTAILYATHVLSEIQNLPIDRLCTLRRGRLLFGDVGMIAGQNIQHFLSESGNGIEKQHTSQPSCGVIAS